MEYAAFISYSRGDSKAAGWLLRRLETYRVPKRLVGTLGAHGIIGPRLGTFFRDREELPAADDLSAVVRRALVESAALIVVCSPAAARSRWVNAEIEAFRRLGRSDRIFAFVVAGVPGPEVCAENCFPPALICHDPAGQAQEPLAADARRGADGRQRAFVRLVAGILGIGYDSLARREAQRRVRSISGIAVLSLIGMVIGLGLASIAYVARNDAARRQARAEDLLGFLVGDFRRHLVNVGNLDLVRSLDDKAIGYYATLDPRDLTDRALEEQARLLTGIGVERTDEGRQDAALDAFREAHARSRALYERDPRNGRRLFDLAQAEYWIGWVAFRQANYPEAEQWLRRYRDSAIRLVAMDPRNFAWQREVASGEQNLAILDERLGRYEAAETGMRRQLGLLQKWLVDRPDDVALRYDATNAASWLGTLSLQQGNLLQARDYLTEAAVGLARNVAAEPANKNWLYYLVDADLLLADVQSQLGRRSAARAMADQAHAAALELTAHDPANNHWRRALGAALSRQSLLPRTPQEARELAALAMQTLEAARAVDPRDEVIGRHLARACITAANLAAARGDTTAARRDVAEALAVLTPPWERAHSEELRLLLAQARLARGDVAAHEGDGAAARASWVQARDLLLEPVAPNAALPFTRLYPLVVASDRLGEAAAAEPYRQRLATAGFVPSEPATEKVSRVDYAGVDR